MVKTVFSLSFFSFLQLCQAKTVALETSNPKDCKMIERFAYSSTQPKRLRLAFVQNLDSFCLIETHLILLFFCVSLCLSTKGGDGGISVPKICQHLALKITRPLYLLLLEKEVSDLIMVLLATWIVEAHQLSYQPNPISKEFEKHKEETVSLFVFLTEKKTLKFCASNM